MDPASPWRGFLAGAAALAGLLGLASASAPLLAFGVGWGLVLVLAWWSSRRGLAALEVRRRLPPSAFEGDLLTVDVAMENHGGSDARFLLAEDQFGAGLQLGAGFDLLGIDMRRLRGALSAELVDLPLLRNRRVGVRPKVFRPTAS